MTSSVPRTLALLTLALLTLLSPTLLRAQSFPAANPLPSPSGVVRGRVLYPDNTPISAADITLAPATGPTLHTTTDPDGTYTFFQVPLGAFELAIWGDGLEATTASATLPDAATTLDLAAIVLRPATVITVSAISQEEAAERDVREEETQRIFGAVPNFFIVYGGQAVPLSARQKFRLSLRTLFDPSNIAVSALMAGGEQMSGAYSGFGTGVPGFTHRFGASFGDASSGILLTGALLPSLFHQDPRYFYKGTGSVPSRVAYVLKNTVEQKGDNGRWQFGWSNLVGTTGSALLSNTYYPSQNNKWTTLTAQNFGLSIAGQGIANLLQEFVLGHLTTHKQP